MGGMFGGVVIKPLISPSRDKLKHVSCSTISENPPYTKTYTKKKS